MASKMNRKNSQRNKENNMNLANNNEVDRLPSFNNLRD